MMNPLHAIELAKKTLIIPGPEPLAFIYEDMPIHFENIFNLTKKGLLESIEKHKPDYIVVFSEQSFLNYSIIYINIDHLDLSVAAMSGAFKFKNTPGHIAGILTGIFPTYSISINSIERCNYSFEISKEKYKKIFLIEKARKTTPFIYYGNKYHYIKEKLDKLYEIAIDRYLEKRTKVFIYSIKQQQYNNNDYSPLFHLDYEKAHCSIRNLGVSPRQHSKTCYFYTPEIHSLEENFSESVLEHLEYFLIRKKLKVENDVPVFEELGNCELAIPDWQYQEMFPDAKFLSEIPNRFPSNC